MTDPAEPGLWQRQQSGNPWWPSYLPRRDDVLSWRHAAAILMRDVNPGAIFAALPELFEAIYDQTVQKICDRLSGVDDRLTWNGWLSVWCQHFSHWNDPVRQLVERNCTRPDAQIFAQMLPRLDGAAICDFVLQAYEAAQITAPPNLVQGKHASLPLHLPFSTGWPFERLAYGFYKLFCSEIDQKPEPAPKPMSDLDFNRVQSSATAPGTAW